MTNEPEVPPVDKDPAALRELARRETEENVVDQQTIGSAGTSDTEAAPPK